MPYSRWQNIVNHTFRTSLTDHEAGHHYSAQHRHLGTAQAGLEAARTAADNARERRGFERTDTPD